jgi:hypothetical protein
VKPVAELARPEPEPAKAAKPVRQIDTAKPVEQPVAGLPGTPEQRQVDAPKQLQQRDAEPSMSAREQRRAEREQRRMERRAERERYYAERKARAVEFVRLRQRPVEEREQPTRPELAFEREAPKPNLFEGLFGRPDNAPPAEGRE